MKTAVIGILATIALAGALAGCADPRVAQVQSSKSLLVGMEKEALLACAGVPERSETTDKAEFLTYEVKQSYSRPRYGIGIGLGHGFGGHRRRHGGFGYYSSVFLPFDYEQRTVGCKATFALKDNKVTGVTYGGVSDSSVRYRQCYVVVENCLNKQVATQ